MNAREYISSFSNKEVCKQWNNNNIPARELERVRDLILLTDSQDIYGIMEYFGDFINPEIITGVICSAKEGEYVEVYVTESSVPYSLSAIYHPLEYYL